MTNQQAELAAPRTGWTKEKSDELGRILATPDFFPAQIDPQRNAALFVRMSRETFRRSSFLDRRMIRAGGDRFYADLDQLSPHVSRADARPLHFILHGAFCGSTLLARYLEELPHCFVLKEPLALAQIAGLKAAASETAVLDPQFRDAWLKAILGLYARAYESDAAVVTKTNDACNWLGPALLDHDRKTRVIFLASPLKLFLMSVLRADGRRVWVRSRVRELGHHISQVPFLRGIALSELDDGQACAAVWLFNSYLCRCLIERSGSKRILVLNSEALILATREIVACSADFLGLVRDEETRAALGNFRLSSQHAKDPSLPYDAAMRLATFDRAEAEFGAEVAAALDWALRVAAGWLPHGPFPIE